MAELPQAETQTIWPLRLDGVVYAAGDERLIHGIDLELAPKGLSVLMGPNGAGKSLTLRLLAGLIDPTAGRILYGGQPGPARKGAVAVVFQRPVMLRRSVAGNLNHALGIYGLAREARPARIADMLEKGQLTDLGDRPARALSAGEQQRLALVRALACEPELLLLDEPTANLDPQATAAIEELVRASVAAGVKCLMVTHDRAQAKRLGEKIIFLHKGRVAEHTNAKSFFKQPASAEARAYMAGELLV